MGPLSPKIVRAVPFKVRGWDVLPPKKNLWAVGLENLSIPGVGGVEIGQIQGVGGIFGPSAIDQGWWS